MSNTPVSSRPELQAPFDFTTPARYQSQFQDHLHSTSVPLPSNLSARSSDPPNSETQHVALEHPSSSVAPFQNTQESRGTFTISLPPGLPNFTWLPWLTHHLFVSLPLSSIVLYWQQSARFFPRLRRPGKAPVRIAPAWRTSNRRSVWSRYATRQTWRFFVSTCWWRHVTPLRFPAHRRPWTRGTSTRCGRRQGPRPKRTLHAQRRYYPRIKEDKEAKKRRENPIEHKQSKQKGIFSAQGYLPRTRSCTSRRWRTICRYPIIFTCSA